MACGIYLIKNKINGKCYVGQSIDIQERWRRHKQDAYKENYLLYRAMRKHGMENFSFEIIEECSIEILDERELFYMISLKALIPDGYNVRLPNSRPAIIPGYVNKAIELLRTSPLTSDEIGLRVGVSSVTIRAINRGSTWRQDNIDYPVRPIANNVKCLVCGKTIPSQNVKYCSKSCANLQPARKVENRPSANTLAKEIYNSSFVAVGKKYGVSDNAIRKWCDAYGIPRRKKEFIEWYEQAPVV